MVPRLQLSNIYLTDSTSSKYSKNPPTSIYTDSDFSSMIDKPYYNNAQYRDTIIEDSVEIESSQEASFINYNQYGDSEEKNPFQETDYFISKIGQTDEKMERSNAFNMGKEVLESVERFKNNYR